MACCMTLIKKLHLQVPKVSHLENENNKQGALTSVNKKMLYKNWFSTANDNNNIYDNNGFILTIILIQTELCIFFSVNSAKIQNVVKMQNCNFSPFRYCIGTTCKDPGALCSFLVCNIAHSSKVFSDQCFSAEVFSTFPGNDQQIKHTEKGS